MIKLNPVYLFDKEGLSEYLHQQALDGNHITYVTSDFLVFKKGEPKDIYFTVLLSDDQPIEKVKRKAIPSSYEYRIYTFEKEEDGFIEIRKQSRFAKAIYVTPLTNYIICLITFSMINSSQNNFLFGSRRDLYRSFTAPILVICILFYCLWLWQRKKALRKAKENHRYLFKNKWDYIGKILWLTIVFISFLVAFGLSYYIIILIFLYLLFHLALYNSIFLLTVLAVFIVFLFLPDNPRKDQNIILNDYFSSTLSVSMYNYDQTLFVSKYENLAAWDYTTSHNVTIVYEYYHVISSWTLNKLEEYLFIQQENPIQLDTYESLNDNSFERAYIKTVEGGVQLYYFQSGYHVLVLANKSPNTTEQVIRFAKMKLNIGG